MSDIIKFDRQLHSDLLNDPTVLSDGEVKFGYYDGGCKMRIGDGKHSYKDLPDTPIRNGGVTCSDSSVSIYPDLVSADDMIEFKYGSDMLDPIRPGNYLIKLNEINIDYDQIYREYANCNFSNIQAPKTLHIESTDNRITLTVPIELYKYSSIPYCKLHSIALINSTHTLSSNIEISCNILRSELLYENSTNLDGFTTICECTQSNNTFIPDIDVIYEECYTYAAQFIFSYTESFSMDIYGWNVDDVEQRLSSCIVNNSITNIDIPLEVICNKHEYNLSNIINFGTKCIKLVDKYNHNFYLYYYNDRYIPTFTYMDKIASKYVYGSMNLFSAYSVITNTRIPIGYNLNGAFTNTLLLESKYSYDNTIEISTGSTINIYNTMSLSFSENSGLNNTSELYTIISQLPAKLINNNNLMFSKDADYTISILPDTISEPMYVLLISDIELPITYLKYNNGNLIINCYGSFYSVATIVLCTSYGKPIKKYEVSIVCTEY